MFIGIVLKLVFGFLGLIVVMRIVGKKALSQVTPFDIIYSIVLGGIVEESVYDDKVHVGHVLFALLVWGTVIYVIETLLQRKDTVAQKVKGHSSVIIYEGRLNIKEIKKNNIEMEQLRSLLREQNCFSLQEVDYAVMEMNGNVTVKPNENKKSAFTYLLVDEGIPEIKSLESIGKNEKWLYEELEKIGYPSIKEIVYTEWSKEEDFYIQTYDDCYNEELVIDG